MGKITITITTDNAAFGENEWEKAAEVSRILDKLATGINLDDAVLDQKVRDTNGNPVGFLVVEDE